MDYRTLFTSSFSLLSHEATGFALPHALTLIRHHQPKAMGPIGQALEASKL